MAYKGSLYGRVDCRKEIRAVLQGRKATAPAEILVSHLAGLLGVRYQPYQPPDPRFKRVWRDRFIGDSARWCERLYSLQDPR